MTAYALQSKVQVTSTGSLPVSIVSQSSITGSVSLSQPATVIQGTVPWLVSGSLRLSEQIFVTTTGSIPVSIQGSISANDPSVALTGSDVPGFATYIGGSSPSGKLQAFRVDAGGNLLLSTTGSIPVSVVSQSAITGSVSLSQPATVLQGTSPWSVSGTVFVTATGSLPVSVQGAISANDPSVSLTGSDVPSSATYIAGRGPDGKLQAFNLDAGRNLFVTTSGSLPVSVTNGVFVTTTGSLAVATTGVTRVTGSVGVDGITFPETISVSGSVSVTSTGSLAVNVTNPVTVSGGVIVSTTGSVPVVLVSSPTLAVSMSNAPIVGVSGSVSVIATTTGSIPVSVSSWLGSSSPTVGQKAMSASLPVVIASNQAPINFLPPMPNSGTFGSVASSITTVTLLAANSSRLGATVFNDSSTSTLRVALGPGASTTIFTTVISPNAYYEVPFYYTGIITGVWTAAVGNARVTELVNAP